MGMKLEANNRWSTAFPFEVASAADEGKIGNQHSVGRKFFLLKPLRWLMKEELEANTPLEEGFSF
jgi:hypothetical protein